MASDAGATKTSVGKALADDPSRFTFLQAMWLLQQALPESIAVGHQGPPDDEPVRLRPNASLAFPPCDIDSVVEQADKRPPYRLTTNFLGLYGAHSPLPNHYAESIVQESSEDDPVRDFLDVFNHRLLSLFARGLLRYRGHLVYNRGGRDNYSWRLFALAGFDSDTLEGLDGIPRHRLLRFAGHWSSHPISASGAAGIISAYFHGIRVTIEQCVPRWVYLDDEQLCRIGQRASRLGVDTTVGSRIPDRMGRFRVVVGPVDMETYKSFLPGSENMTALSSLARLASGGWHTFDVELILRGEDSPQLSVSLGDRGELGRSAGFFSKPSDDVPIRFDRPVGVG